MMPVLLGANFAKQIPFHLIQLGPFPVLNVPTVVPAKKAAPNVPIVHLVNLKTVSTTNAMRVQQDGTHWNWTLQHVPNVLRVKLH